MVYGLPGGRDGGVPGNMKLGEHAPGPTTSADGERRRGCRRATPHGRVRATMVAGLEPEPVAEYDCLYTWTPSEDFFIQRHGRLSCARPAPAMRPNSRP